MDPAEDSVSLSPVLISPENGKSFHIPIKVIGEEKTVDMLALIDSGATGEFIGEETAEKLGAQRIPLQTPMKVYNVDGTKNKTGMITHCTWLKLLIGTSTINTRFLISGLGKQEMILGLPWLKFHNPNIKWKEGTIDITPKRTLSATMKRMFELQKAEPQNRIDTIKDEEEEVDLLRVTGLH